MLLDSNIVIYLFKPEYQQLRAFVTSHEVCCSAITYLETMGYHQLPKDEEEYLEQYFQIITVHPISDAVINMATTLRQRKKMALGDAIVAATALQQKQPLVTRNVQDFNWVKGLEVINPLDDVH